MSISVEITGISAVTPIGVGIAEFTDGLKNGHTNYTSVTLELENQQFQFPIAQNPDLDIKKCFQQHPSNDELFKKAIRVRNLSKGLQMGVYATLDAWCNADLNTTQVDLSRVAIVACGSNFQAGNQLETMEKYRLKLQSLSASYGINFLDTDIVGTISELMGIKGEGYTLGAASASGNMGVVQGSRLIRTGEYDVVIVVAPMMSLSIYEFVGFTEMGAMAKLKADSNPEYLCRPFDKDHAGFVFGENAACVILESSEHMQKRNAASLAEIKGYGVVLDANRNPNPNLSGEATAMGKALEMAGISGNQVDYVNSHGSSSPLGDQTEAEALQLAGCHSALVNSTKSLIGHGITSAGLVEVVASVIQMNEGFVHESRNLESAVKSDINWAKSLNDQQQLSWCISNSYGFGGINTSLVLKNKINESRN